MSVKAITRFTSLLSSLKPFSESFGIPMDGGWSHPGTDHTHRDGNVSSVDKGDQSELQYWFAGDPNHARKLTKPPPWHKRATVSFFNLSPIRMPIFIRWHVWYYLSLLYLYLQVSITQVFIWMLKEARDQSGAEWLNTHWLLKGTWCRIRRTLGSGSLFCKRQEALQRSCERSYRQNSAT